MIIGIIGCGICCMPLLLPIAAGISGFSIFSFLSADYFWAIILLLLAITLVGIYRMKKKKVCDLPAINSE